MRIPIGLQTWPNDAQLTAEQLINCYAQQAPGTSRTPVRLRSGPGLTQEVEVAPTSATMRGLYSWNDVLYAVIGDTLYEKTGSGTWTSRGTITVNTVVDSGLGAGVRAVSMAALESDTLAIVTGAKAYEWNGTTLTDQTAASNMPANPSWVAELNNRLIFGGRDSSLFVWSGVGDGFTINGAATVNAIGSSDIVLVGVVANRELYCCGTESIEVFYDTGRGNVNAFDRSGDGLINVGVASEYCVTLHHGVLYFVGNDGKIYALAGRSLRPISTPAIEEHLRTLNSLKDCEAHAFSYGGSHFVVFQFPGGAMSSVQENGTERTFVYDIGTDLWHERRSGSETWWRVRGAVNFGGDNVGVPRVYCGDRYSGHIFYLAHDSSNEDNVAQEMIVRTPYLENGGKRITLHGVEAHCEVGQDNVFGPTAILKTTRDGETYSTGLSRSLGADGETDTRVYWKRQGQYRKVALEFTFAGDANKTLYYVEAEVEPHET